MFNEAPANDFGGGGVCDSREGAGGAPAQYTQHAHPQYSIDCSSLNISQKALETLPDDVNIMPKHVGAPIHT
jgi:hypothetical protein